MSIPLQSRNWRQNCEMTRHQKHRSIWQSKHRCPSTCYTPILEHPDPATKLSPVQCVFGRPIKDFKPILPSHYIPHPTWSETLASREEAFRHRHMKEAEPWTVNTRRLPPRAVGHCIRIQNQTGPLSNK